MLDELWFALEDGWFAEEGWLAALLEAAWFALLVELALDGWLLDVLLVEALLASESPWTPSAARVCWSSSPAPEIPCCCWKLCSACFVCGPMMPSICPGS